MSKDLDKKLKEILAQPHTDSIGGTVMTFITDKTVEQIKDCLIADGWVSQPILKYVMQTKGNEPIMTGEEWYKKFEQELEREKQYGDRVHYMWNTSTVLEAAKRASGVKR